jgi:hypothetical protein
MAKRLVPSPELGDALKKVLDHLNQNPGKAEMHDEPLWLEYGTKYIRVWWAWTVLILTPDGKAYQPGRGAGRLPNFNKPVGNIIRLVHRKNWQKQVWFTLNKSGTPETIAFSRPPRQAKCTVPGCGRTTNLANTVLGLRCSRCRAVDIRHMNSVRQLGGMPRANGKALKTNDDYLIPK